jgi:hypothetical protein
MDAPTYITIGARCHSGNAPLTLLPHTITLAHLGSGPLADG